MAFHHVRGLCQRLIHVLRVHQQRVARWLLIAQVVVEIGLLRQPRARRPSDFHLVCGLDGLPGLLRDHSDEILFHHDFHVARQILHRTFIDADDCRAHGGRTHHSSVQHAGNAHVVDKFELPGY